MNTKKIMALTLAALMAAGSTSTVFAAKSTDALDFIDATAYESKDGVLVEDTDGIAPGDTVYYRLDEDLSAEDKDKDRLNVYADWKVGGDNVESIDIVYKKGNFQSTGNEQVVGYDYAFSSGKMSGVTVYIAGAKLEDAALKTNDAIKAEVDKKYVVESGYAESNKYYADADALVAAMSSTYTGSQTAYRVTAGKNHADSEIVDLLKDAGFTLFAGSNLYVGASDESNGYGDYSEQSEDSTTTPFSGDKSAVYINAETGKFVDTASGKIDAITDFLTAADDAVGVTVEQTATAYSKSGELFWDAAEAAADAVANAGAENAAGKYVDASNNVLANQEAAINDAFTSSPSATPKMGAKDGYTYWVEVKTKDNDTTKVLDVAGTLYIGTTKNKAEDESNDNKLSVSLELSNRNTDYYNPTPVEDEATIEPDANGAVKFADDAEEVTIYFGENEDAWYTFNAKGQSDVNFAYTMKFNSEIADLFPKANIDFITWTATPATNRTGDLYITADEDTFLYEVTEDGIKEVNGAKYDEDEGAWHIRTRKLTAYAISDIELDTSVKLDNDSSSSTSSGSNTDGGKDNPDTGR